MNRRTEQDGERTPDHGAGSAADRSRGSHAREASRIDQGLSGDDGSDAYDGGEATSLPQPGDVIAGKYRVQELLGHGGMGAVFGAIHLVSGKHVALKWMLRSSSRERERSRFVREARVAARVDHPNVVDVYDIGQDGDRGLYLVMQLLRGESLAARIDRGRMEIVETIDLLVQAMRGVAAVHAAGVIHRDLKPDNIFLCGPREDGSFDAKVLDFGISAVTGRDLSDVTLTRDGAILGTPCYMSPEQLRDSRAIDVRADVYAFGVILFEALTGEVPFRSNSHNGLVFEIFTNRPPSPRTLRSELAPGLAKVILRALEKERDARFPSVDALIDALVPYGSGARRSLPPQTQARGWIWVACGVALLVLGSLASYAYKSVPRAAPLAPRVEVSAPQVELLAPQVETPKLEAPKAVQVPAPPLPTAKPLLRAPIKLARPANLMALDAGLASPPQPRGNPEPRVVKPARSGTISLEDI
jgi:eukaryotic-like serine/threonine-protein kinase